MVMQPTANDPSSNLVGSQYSAGGALAPTPSNNFNVQVPPPTQNYGSNYGLNFNPSAGYSSLNYYGANQQNQSNANNTGLLSGNSPITSLISAGKNLFGTGSSVINGGGADLGFAPTSLSAANLTSAGGFSGVMAPITDMTGSLTGAAGSTIPGGSAGFFGSGSTLSGTLGAAGLGAFAGSFLGKIGGNSTGGSIGGGIGAGIGMAVGGPVGGVIGGLIGGIGGGFFGNSKPSNKTQGGGVSIDGTISPADVAKFSYAPGSKKYDAGNASIRDAYDTSSSNLMKYLQANGATPKDPKDQLALVVGNRDGYIYHWYQKGADGSYPSDVINQGGPQWTTIKSGDTKAYGTSLAQSIIDHYNVPPDLQTKLKGMDFTTFEKFNPNAATGGAIPQAPMPNIPVTQGQFAQFMATRNKTTQ